MNDFSRQIYDPGFQMGGRHLISASAGTGKTYSMQSLYLRHILQDGYAVRQILVVTYTRAATRELRARLRQILQDAADALADPAAAEAAEERIRSLLRLVPDGPDARREAARRIHDALQDFDAAPIFTIHGFCSRVLTRYAFETGQPFDTEPGEDSDEAIERLCLDWWRSNVYTMDREQFESLRKDKVDFALLLELVTRKIAKPDAVLQPAPRPHPDLLADLSAVVAALRDAPPPPAATPEALDGFRRASGLARINAKTVPRILEHLAALGDFREDVLARRGPLGWKDIRAFLRLDPGRTFVLEGRERDIQETFAPAWHAARQEALAILKEGVFAVVAALAEDYQKKASQRETTTFNDYLYNLREALRGPDARDLVRLLREEFKVALIDEFQDTDPIQWGIFSAVFPRDAEDSPCFLIGDPKQAIYRFRDGDITTYQNAAASVREPNRHELGTNYRSEADLVQAVNEIFRDRGGGDFTFDEKIPYPGTLQARGKPPQEALTIAGAPDPRPFRVVETPDDPQCAYHRTAEAIAALLNDPETRIAGRPVRPQQIAVLVNRHEEADAIARLLKQRDIPVIRQATGDVWKSPEAGELLQLLNAVLHSEDDLDNLRSALLLPEVGYRPEDLALLNDNRPAAPAWSRPEDRLPDGLAAWIRLFCRLKEKWLAGSFAAMFQDLMDSLHLQRRCAVSGNGLRTLTNLLHLAELVQQELTGCSRTPEHLFDWMRKRIASEEEGGTQCRLRIESDADAVRIMTIFTSKGLEFPVVFVPTLSFLKYKRREQRIFEAHNERQLLEIALQEQEGFRSEIQEEHVRLAYVAFTRAVNRVEVLYARDRREYNILGRLFGRPFGSGPEHVAFLAPPAGQGLDAVTRYHDPDPPGAAPVLAAPPPLPAIRRAFSHSSFSSLAAARDRSVKDRDGESRQVDDADAGEGGSQPPAPIFLFPSGAKTGTCWHEILEDLDFAAGEDAVRALAAEKLRLYGFLRDDDPQAQALLDCTAAMVQGVLRNPLPQLRPGAGTIILGRLGSRDRRPEWRFDFTTARPGPDAAPGVDGARRPCVRRIIEALAEYPEYLRLVADPDSPGWEDPIPRGYVTGFLDLLFRSGGAYFVVDWKSNVRDRRTSDFDRAGLEQEIRDHHYWLQFLLYSTALHQFLAHALPDYDFPRHFGGVYYVFLRGHDNPETRGIYATRPPEALLDAISSLIGDFR